MRLRGQARGRVRPIPSADRPRRRPAQSAPARLRARRRRGGGRPRTGPIPRPVSDVGRPRPRRPRGVRKCRERLEPRLMIQGCAAGQSVARASRPEPWRALGWRPATPKTSWIRGASRSARGQLVQTMDPRLDPQPPPSPRSPLRSRRRAVVPLFGRPLPIGRIVALSPARTGGHRRRAQRLLAGSRTNWGPALRRGPSGLSRWWRARRTPGSMSSRPTARPSSTPFRYRIVLRPDRLNETLPLTTRAFCKLLGANGHDADTPWLVVRVALHTDCAGSRPRRADRCRRRRCPGCRPKRRVEKKFGSGSVGAKPNTPTYWVSAGSTPDGLTLHPTTPPAPRLVPSTP